MKKIQKLIYNNRILTLLIVPIFGVFYNISAMPNIIILLANEFNIQFNQSSVFMYAYQISYGISALFVSYCNLKFSVKNSLIFSLSLYSIVSYMYVFIDNFNILAMLRILSGISASFIVPSSLYIITDYKNKGKIVSFVFSFISICGLIGILSSGFLTWRLLFFIPALLTTVGLILLIIFYKKNKDKVKNKATLLGIIKDYYILLKAKKRLIVFSLIFINNFFIAGIYSYIGLYLKNKYMIEKSTISLLILIISFGGIIGNIISGILLDKNNRKYVILLGLFSIASANFLLFTDLTFFFIVIPLFLFGAGRTLIHTTLINQFMLFSPEFSSHSTSLNSFIVFSSSSLGIAFVSKLIVFLPFHHYIGIVSCTYLLILFYFLISFKN